MEAPAQILVADDDEDIRTMVSTALRRDGYGVIEATDGDEALELARERAPDLLVLDVSMPGRSGFDVCRELRHASPASPPVLFLTARSETRDRVEGLDAGAVDYVVKPFSLAELAARVRAALRTKFAEDRLREQATLDSLTGLLNRGQLAERVGALVAAARRDGKPLACLMIDLDRFKTVNDSHGHQAGDAVLAEVGRRLRRSLRMSDIALRYGGEEFLALLPDTDLTGALSAAKKLRRALTSRPVSYDVPAASPVQIPIRVSIGVACLDDRTQDGTLLVAAADSALYRAKERGRGRIETPEPLSSVE
jgi:diguanylate cyclase (GGDEF)-like protein